MPRKPRKFDPRLPYHITARGNGKQQVFFRLTDYETYLEILGEKLIERDVQLYHYCLMPNHIHLMFARGSTRIPGIMCYVQREYARYQQKRGRLPGHVWQSRYYDRPIADAGALIICGNYIELNPVRAGLADSPAGWRYSSYHYYAGGRGRRLVTPNPLYETMGTDLAARQRCYREQVEFARRLYAVPKALEEARAH